MELSTERLHELLVGGKFIKPREFDTALEQATLHTWSVPKAVVELGFLSDAQVGSLIAEELGFTFADLVKDRPDPTLLNLFSEDLAEHQAAVPFKRVGKSLWIATSNVDNYEFFKLVEKRFREPVTVVYATPIGIESSLKLYQEDLVARLKLTLDSIKRGGREEDVIRLVELLVNAAFDQRASDIHIEPEKEEVIVRFRVDGSLHEVLRYPLEVHEKVIFRVKILSRLRTDEHAQAQDGRFELRFDGSDVNLRVSILPVTHGENVVMRLLSAGFQRLRLEDLGLQADDLEKVKRAVAQPHGMILAAGPTGSGKTTTLYASMVIVNQPDVNLMTIEDPVEYDIAGIRQIQVNPRTNLTFDAGLRSIVRQDPDIIMVGEIRDPDTASIAVNAALTGHLLLSSIHANDAAATFPRLYEMNVEPFLIASSLNVIIAQRLVRRICSHCMESNIIDPEERELLERDEQLKALVRTVSGKSDLSKLRIYKGHGCQTCGHTGYAGRLGIFEVLEINEAIRPLIVNKANSEEIRTFAKKQGFRTMTEDGVEKVFQGRTTLSEIIRATKV